MESMKSRILKKLIFSFFLFLLFSFNNTVKSDEILSYEDFNYLFDTAINKKQYGAALELATDYKLYNPSFEYFIDYYFTSKVYLESKDYQNFFNLCKIYIVYSNNSSNRLSFSKKLSDFVYFDKNLIEPNLFLEISNFINSDLTQFLISEISIQDKSYIDEYYYDDLFNTVINILEFNINTELNSNLILANEAFNIYVDEKVNQDDPYIMITSSSFFDMYLKLLYKSKDINKINLVFNYQLNNFFKYKDKNKYFPSYALSRTLIPYHNFLLSNNLSLEKFDSDMLNIENHFYKFLNINDFIYDLSIVLKDSKYLDRFDYYINLVNKNFSNINKLEVDEKFFIYDVYFFTKATTQIDKLTKADYEILSSVINYGLEKKLVDEVVNKIPFYVYAYSYHKYLNYDDIKNYYNFLITSFEFPNKEDQSLFDAQILISLAQLENYSSNIDNYFEILNKLSDSISYLKTTKYSQHEVLSNYEELILNNFNFFEDANIVEKMLLEKIENIPDDNSYNSEMLKYVYYSDLLKLFTNEKNFPKAQFYFDIISKSSFINTSLGEWFFLISKSNFYVGFEMVQEMEELFEDIEVNKIIDKNLINYNPSMDELLMTLNILELSKKFKDLNYQMSDRFYKINNLVKTSLLNENSSGSLITYYYFNSFENLIKAADLDDEDKIKEIIFLVNEDISSIIKIFDELFINHDFNFDSMDVSYYKKWSSFIDVLTLFDPPFFNYIPESIALTDSTIKLLEIKYKNEFYKTLVLNKSDEMIENLYNRNLFYADIKKDNNPVYKKKLTSNIINKTLLSGVKNNEAYVYLNNIEGKIFVTIKTTNLNLMLKSKNSDQLIKNIEKVRSSKFFYDSIYNNKFDYQLSNQIFNDLFPNYDVFKENFPDIDTLIFVKDTFFNDLPLNILISDLNNINSNDLTQQSKVRWLFQDYNLINLANPYFQLTEYKNPINSYVAFSVSSYGESNKLLSQLFRSNSNLTIDFNELDDLPYAIKEVNDSSNIFQNEKIIFKNSEASEDNFKKLKINTNLLHFATHAISGNNKIPSSIILSPPSKKNLSNDGILTPFEIVNSDVQSDIVILSACSTAFTRNNLQNGIEGLVQAFFINKTRAILTTIFPIEDKFTSNFVPKLLKNFKDIDYSSLSLAHNQTLLDYINSQNYVNPLLWSSFEFIHKDIY